jgi:hypothetical protein
VTGGDIDDVALLADLVDVGAQDDLHDASSVTCSSVTSTSTLSSRSGSTGVGGSRISACGSGRSRSRSRRPPRSPSRFGPRVCVTRLASKASPAYRDRFLAGCLPAGTGAGETGTDFFSLEASEASAFFDFSDPAAADLAGLAALAVESFAFAVGSFGADAAGCSWAAGADAVGFSVANSSFARSQCSVSLPEGYPSSSQSAYARCLI